MKRLAHSFLGFLASSLLAWCLAASAQVPAASCPRPSADDSDQALSRLNGLRVRRCLGGIQCDSPLCQKVAQFEERWRDKPTSDTTYRDARVLFNDIRASGAALPRTALAVPELQRMFQTWDSALGGGGALSAQQLGGLETKQWEVEPGDFRLFARSPNAQIVLKDKFKERCADTATCTAAVAEAIDVIEHSHLVHRVLRVALGADAVLAPYFEALRARWSAYNNESRAIYPWELALNGRLLKAPTEGFAEPPDRQILLLHPGGGMTYRPSQNGKDSDTRGVITLDIIGIYRWRWGGANGTQITNASGWSLATGWDGRGVGYGLGFHFSDNRSAYLMRDRDGRTMFVVSLDLGNYLRDKEAAVDDLRERVRGLR